jgi:signal transduction histidine kinase
VFLSTASHELKTPLSSVMAYAELLDDNEGKLNTDQRSQFLGRLRGEASRLMTLIDEILDLTRLETGKFNLRTAAVQVTEMVHGAVEVVRAQASRYGLEIRERFDPDLPALTIDEVKMRQVVTHLLRNAMKSSPDQGVITVGAALEKRAVIITVHDTGPAIRPNEATDIFELFGQGVREESARGGGLGIGLHLAKRIAELHGGHVGVNSRPGEGSTFWVRLPIPDRDEVEAAEPEGARAAVA